MKVFNEGHSYGLQNQDNPRRMQVLQFIEKRPVSHDATGKMYTEKDGTTNEEVIAVLIHRLNYLNNQFPSPFNFEAIAHLESALHNLEARTAERKSREVEGLARK